jgi:HTH-type transcriptional regulator/antitoxin HigA
MGKKNCVPAEVFPPGEFLREELEARGWSQADFAEIIGREPTLISEIISAKRAITPDTARAIGEALETGARVWLNLESEYRLRLAESSRPIANDIAPRAKLFSLYPVREMIRRGWIQHSTNVQVLESRLQEFSSSKPCCVARKAQQGDVTPLQRAWFHRAYNLAGKLCVERYSDSKLKSAFGSLRGFLHEPVEARHIPRVLGSAGVRFLVLEALPSSKIDGACFWLDNKSPVVVVSLRFDRIDNFWFTLIHELKHVEHRHALQEGVLDIDLMEQMEHETIAEERKVNEETKEFLIPQAELEDFINRVRPFFSATKIVGFAARLGVHPGIVVGQLQRRGIIGWNHHRKYLMPIRSIVAESAPSDGWGNFL